MTWENLAQQVKASPKADRALGSEDRKAVSHSALPGLPLPQRLRQRKARKADKTCCGAYLVEKHLSQNPHRTVLYFKGILYCLDTVANTFKGRQSQAGL